MVTTATTTCVGQSSCKVSASVTGSTTTLNILNIQATINILGDNGPATLAGLNFPAGAAVRFGNLYIADTNNHRVRMVNAATGIIHTIAGTGTNTGATVDVGTAGTSMQLSYPNAVTVDASGNVYIADTNHHRIRLWNAATGIIATSVGTGAGGLAGGDFGPATSAWLNYPKGVALDIYGVLYIADTSNCRIRRVSPSGMIETIAGYNGAVNGISCGSTGDSSTATSALLNLPSSVYFDTSNNMYIADTSNHKIRKVAHYCYSGCTNIIKTLAGTGIASFSGDGGAPTSATLNNPYSVVVDSGNNVFISDPGNQRIRKVYNSTGLMGTFAGTGTAGYDGDYVKPSGMSKMNNPGGLCIDASKYNSAVYLADTGSHAIRAIVYVQSHPTGQPTTVPTMQPSQQPSEQPSRLPTRQPSSLPTQQPTAQPSRQPTQQPSTEPTSQPSSRPSRQPSSQPSQQPSQQPTSQPSSIPSSQPTMQPSGQPTRQPTRQPTQQPTRQPTRRPSQQPTQQPTRKPSAHPSSLPSRQPTRQPTGHPTRQPTRQPSQQPTTQPTMQPSLQPVGIPTMQPSRQPSCQPTSQPTRQPTARPSKQPVGRPSAQPSRQPNSRPSSQPSRQPSRQPTRQPSQQPTQQPTRHPTQQPSSRPTRQPLSRPTTRYVILFLVIHLLAFFHSDSLCFSPSCFVVVLLYRPTSKPTKGVSPTSGGGGGSLTAPNIANVTVSAESNYLVVEVEFSSSRRRLLSNRSVEALSEMRRELGTNVIPGKCRFDLSFMRLYTFDF